MSIVILASLFENKPSVVPFTLILDSVSGWLNKGQKKNSSQSKEKIRMVKVA
jgi:hypothetical protein